MYIYVISFSGYVLLIFLSCLICLYLLCNCKFPVKLMDVGVLLLRWKHEQKTGRALNHPGVFIHKAVSAPWMNGTSTYLQFLKLCLCVTRVRFARSPHCLRSKLCCQTVKSPKHSRINAFAALWHTLTKKQLGACLYLCWLLHSCLSAHTSLFLSPHHASPTLFSFRDTDGETAASQTKLMGGCFVFYVNFCRTRESNQSHMNFQGSESFRRMQTQHLLLLCHATSLVSLLLFEWMW